MSEWTLSPDLGPRRPRSRMDVHFSSATDDWFTPDDVFRALDAEFGFEVDVCASAENAKCRQFFTRDDNGLRQKWTGVCWMNPPYGRGIWQWVQKACESAGEGSTVVCLLPSRTDTDWWHRFVMPQR